MQRETTGVAVRQYHIQVLEFSDDLNILGSSIEDTERSALVLEQAACRIGLKINAEKNQNNGDNTDVRSLAYEFRYLGTVKLKMTSRKR